MRLNKLKFVLVLMFVAVAGIIYSCKHSDEPDVISLDNNEDISTSEYDLELTETPPNKDNHETNESLQEKSTIESGTKIYVHICGAVNKPDVYEINQNTRLYELVKLAGGFTDAAANDYINQATILTDGQQVYIPTKKEVEDLDFKPSINESMETTNEKININKASKEELMTLTGIGESKANSIIDYRQKNGNFNDIEEVMNISGIKDSVFSKISDDITVD
ncbi:MAG TPA: ComEA family DNA-binding protein [Clostridiales bacterium]|nr:ComEA family DNA-binding protein [Clostridiales bacterium]